MKNWRPTGPPSAEEWSSLGLEIQRICVADLAEQVRGDAERLEELGVQGDPQGWLASFLDIVGECWRRRSGVDLSPLRGLIPNQNEYLRSPQQLKRDQGVAEQLKDICTTMRFDIRDQLLLNGFDDIARTLEFADLTAALEKAIPTSVTEDEVLQEAVKHMGARLPEGKDLSKDALDIQRGAVRFLAHLWESKAHDGGPIAREVPLVTSSGRAMRWSTNRLFMGPVRVWPETARPFSDAYPPTRVLGDLYAGSESQGIPDVTVALAAWGIAYNDPITNNTVAELTERRLAALSEIDAAGVVVREQPLSQIALLQPEVLNRCQEGFDQARALLGLVLCDVARRDPSWKEWRTAKGRKSSEDVEISVRGALWLADLKVRAWVPQPGEDGRPQKMVANAATLKDVLDPAWLQDNDDAILLLSECFGFDQLELRLIGMVEDKEERQQLRDSLAGLVETAGANPEFYTALAADVKERRKRERNVARCRNLGLAVQQAVGAALKRHDLRVKLVDKGFDYEVAFAVDDVIEDGGTSFEVGPYLVEVKATTTGRARLTPTQAATASQTPRRYVLCVVDLRDVSQADLEWEWTTDRVGPLAKLVSSIGGTVGETYETVKTATELDVGIRNESALRYEVPPEIWESGVSITRWVRSVRSELQ